MEWIILTTKSVTINSKEYFERKYYSPWINQFGFTNSYERIDDDSAHYILTANNRDSLLFNFNWEIGKKFIVGTDGNILNGQRIDSVKITNTFLNDDTVFVLKNFTYNIITGDTNFNVLPEYNYLSKKIGRLDAGMWVYATGVKINETRYGDVYPYPEEVTLSADSIFIPTEFYVDSITISNNSESDVRIDSIISFGAFYGYWGYLGNDNYDYTFYFSGTIPGSSGYPLGIDISSTDSIKFWIWSIDLCPICKKQPDEYFEENLRFVFSFTDGINYSFSKIIPISGEGHPSDIEVLPNAFTLYQNYPNPFNPSTKISWQSPVGGWQTLEVYDVLGNEVATLVDEEKPAGSYEIKFKSLIGSHKLASGIYYYQLRAGDFVETKKMILLR